MSVEDSSETKNLRARSDLHVVRKLWHMMTGLLMVLIYTYLLSQTLSILVLISLLAVSLYFEVNRLRDPKLNEKVVKLWGPVMRTHEIHKLSGTPYYIAAAALSIAIFPKEVACMAILFLAFGDPMASLIGIMCGEKGIRINAKKTVAGVLAAALTCGFFAWAYSVLWMSMSGADRWGLFGAGFLAGVLNEMLPLEVDDNLSIPMISGFVMWVAFLVIGI